MDQCESTDEMIINSVELLKEKEHIVFGDKILITAGVPVGKSGTTNMIKIHVAE